METPDFIQPEPPPLEPEYEPGYPRTGVLAPGLGERLTWITGVVLMVSALTGWYTGHGEGLRIAVIGWHTGVLGQLVFFIGFALVVLVVLQEVGIEPPAAVPIRTKPQYRLPQLDFPSCNFVSSVVMI